MDEPNQRNEKGSDKEHDALFFNDTILMGIKVFKSDSLNSESH